MVASRTLLVATLAAAAAVRAAPRPTRPNIVIILADDLGAGDAHYFNPTRGRIPTPHIDQLCREGMIFTDAHSASSVCTPTRYGILTGRYPWRTRLQHGVLGTIGPPLIPADRPTIGTLLRAAGYATAAIGKWHVGMTWPVKPGAKPDRGAGIDYSRPIKNSPITRGFDYYFGISASLDMPPYVFVQNDRFLGAATVEQHTWFRHGLTDPNFHAVDVLPELTRKAVAYVKQRAAEPAKPFFLYFALTAPHTPIVPTPAWRGRSGLGQYGDFVMEVDWSVGEVLAALDRTGLAAHTLVFLSSDNGCSAGPAKAADLEKLGHYPSGPYRGFKSDLWEGGHRMPLAARWPGRIRPDTRSGRLVCLNDLLATCVAAAGGRIPPHAAEDSVSFLPTLLGKAQPPRPAVVHASAFGYFAISQGQWKLLLAHGSGGWSSPTETEAIQLGLPGVQLYDLKLDPGEQHNVASEHPAIVARLAATLGEIVAAGRTTPGPRETNDVPVNLWKHPSPRQRRPPPVWNGRPRPAAKR